MASVFLSYDRDDADRARHFARALEKSGHHVWWDLHIRGGAQFSKVIEEALSAADAVVVLWSVNSIESAWVRDEAAAGRDSGRLVPVTIDGAQAPLGFRQFQTIDLSRWNGRGSPAGLRTLLADVAATAQSRERPKGETADTLPAAPLLAPAERLRPRTQLLVAALAAAAILVPLLVVFRPWQGPDETTPSVAVSAADSSQLSKDMARNLLVKLGSAQANEDSTVRLPDDIGPGPADIRLAVNGTRDGNVLRANLSLISARGKTMLWSSDFERPAADRSALEESIASAAARALVARATKPRANMGD